VGADRLVLVRESGDAKEYVGAVGGAHLCGFARMRGHPVTDALPRYRVARDEVAVDEHALDRAIGIAVVRIEADAQRRAVLEDDAPGSFELKRQQVERISEPANLKPLPVEGTGLDGAAVVVRDELVVLVAAADAHTLVGKCRRAGLVAGRDQITWAAVERDMKFRTREARAHNDRFEIAGQKPL